MKAGLLHALRSTSGIAVLAVTAALGPVSVAAHEADQHAHHHATAAGTSRSTVDYVMPDVNLARADGKSVSFRQELNDGRPVVMNFIYTTCTSICPLTSQTFR